LKADIAEMIPETQEVVMEIVTSNALPTNGALRYR
jgi:hypothetical protein